MQYTLRLIEHDGNELARLGTFYTQGRAEYHAIQGSRANSSPNVFVIIETNERRKGFPRLYRQGRRYYRP